MAIESVALTHAHEEYGANYQGGHYADVAESLGAWSRRVEQPDAFLPALEEALTVTAEGRPAVIECVVKAGYVWPGRGEPGS